MRRLALSLAALALAGCGLDLCGTGFDVVRLDDSGRVVARWPGVSDIEILGGCISFREGCAGEPRVECGNVARVRGGES